ncbi:MAG: HNH endonuclease [Patescibacteria group bacterium]|nr:HNH endonuclease [Patescibacteria group bacterium]
MMDESNLRYDPESGELLRVRKLTARGAVWFGDKQYPATHIIWYLVTGEWPAPGEVIDHIDGNPQNNKWSNLRKCSHTENMRNVIRDTRIHDRDLGLERGVQRRGNRFIVTISGFYVGIFKTIEEANAEARAFRQEYHGEYAPENRSSNDTNK